MGSLGLRCKGSARRPAGLVVDSVHAHVRPMDMTPNYEASPSGPAPLRGGWAHPGYPGRTASARASRSGDVEAAIHVEAFSCDERGIVRA